MEQLNILNAQEVLSDMINLNKEGSKLYMLYHMSSRNAVHRNGSQLAFKQLPFLVSSGPTYKQPLGEEIYFLAR